MSVNFAACSDDDEDIDVAQLEGTWGLTNDEGYEIYEGERDSWNDQYDPSNPTDDCEKVVISKGADGIYSMVHYEYYNNQWQQYGTEKFTLDGNNLIPADGDAEVESVKLLVANGSQLVLEIKGTDEDGEFYNKMTYKRM
ncbi:lipocalin family protein [Bacteroides faecis]